MQSKASRRSAFAVAQVRRLIIEIPQPGPPSRMTAFIAMIAGWAVFAGFVGFALLAIGLL